MTSRSRRAALRSMGALALAFGARDIALGAAIVAVRVWPADEYTRITIESDAALAGASGNVGNSLGEECVVAQVGVRVERHRRKEDDDGLM